MKKANRSIAAVGVAALILVALWQLRTSREGIPELASDDKQVVSWVQGDRLDYARPRPFTQVEAGANKARTPLETALWIKGIAEEAPPYLQNHIRTLRAAAAMLYLNDTIAAGGIPSLQEWEAQGLDRETLEEQLSRAKYLPFSSWPEQRDAVLGNPEPKAVADLLEDYGISVLDPESDILLDAWNYVGAVTSLVEFADDLITTFRELQKPRETSLQMSPEAIARLLPDMEESFPPAEYVKDIEMPPGLTLEEQQEFHIRSFEDTIDEEGAIGLEAYQRIFRDRFMSRHKLAPEVVEPLLNDLAQRRIRTIGELAFLRSLP